MFSRARSTGWEIEGMGQQTESQGTAPKGAGGGVALIAAERRRQVEAEGWTSEHDDEHRDGSLAVAAACYATQANQGLYENGRKAREAILAYWPWDAKWWKPTPDDRIRELVKAGALIAAEIDRLQRKAALAKAGGES